LALRRDPPGGLVMSVDAFAPELELPMDRPLYRPPVRAKIDEQEVEVGDAEIPADALFDQVYVDKERLRAILRQALQTRRQISLEELLAEHPLRQGAAELVAWLSIAEDERRGVIDESRTSTVVWEDAAGRAR